MAWSVWIRSLWSLSQYEDNLSLASYTASMLSVHDAIPVSESVSVVYSVLCRCIDMGLSALIGCFIQSLRVPVIELDDLINFFTSNEVCYLSFVFLVVLFICFTMSDESLGNVLPSCEIAENSETNNLEFSLKKDSSTIPIASNTNSNISNTVDLSDVIKNLKSEIDNLRDTQDRFSLIYVDYTRKIDEQMRQLFNHNRNNNRAIHEVKGVIQSIVAEIGVTNIERRATDSFQERFKVHPSNYIAERGHSDEKTKKSPFVPSERYDRQVDSDTQNHQRFQREYKKDSERKDFRHASYDKR